MLLIVDGSHRPHRAGGAGFVLLVGPDPARPFFDAERVATHAESFKAKDANDAELEAILRGARWACHSHGAPADLAVYSDNTSAVDRACRRFGINAHHLTKNIRGPYHAAAHRLAFRASMGVLVEQITAPRPPPAPLKTPVGELLAAKQAP